MINRFQPKEGNWRTSQQLPGNTLFKSPQKIQMDGYGAHPAYQVEKENQVFGKNLMMPSVNIGKSKPLISPKKMQHSERITQGMGNNRKSIQMGPQSRYNSNNFLTERNDNGVNCLNHPSKKAEFLVSADSNEEEYYCGRCAAQLATQGWEVQKIDNVQNVSMKMSKKNDLPNLPQYENEPIYQQIKEILKLCNNVVEEHQSNIENFSSLEEGYQNQIDLTSCFYDRLVEIIEEMKADHIADLMAERDKYTQIADIQNDNLRENIIEINVIKNDIQNHIEEVLEGIRQSGDNTECRESLDHYRQKLTLFRHQTEEQMENLKDVTRYPQEKIDNMITVFENFLGEMWEDGNEAASREEPIKPMGKNLNSAMTVKNIHQILPKGVNYENEGKRAFRNLEDDEDDNMQERKSPNFKRI